MRLDQFILLHPQFLNQASTVDTPLHTVEMFRRKQESGQAAYLVLSGGQQALQT